MQERIIPSLAAVGKMPRGGRKQDTAVVQSQPGAVCSYLEPHFASPDHKVSLVFVYAVPEDQHGSDSRKVTGSCSYDISRRTELRAHCMG